MLALYFRNLTLILFIVVLLLSGLLHADQKLSGYCKTEAGMETNILESDSTSRNSFTTPVLANLHFYLNKRQLSFNVNTTGGLLAYDYRPENKATFNISARANYTISRKFFLASTVSSFQKWWLEQDYAYHNSDWLIGGGLSFNRWNPSLYLVLSQNSFRHRNSLDNHQIGGLGEISEQINPSLTFSAQSGYFQIDYPRRPLFSIGNSVLDTTARQKDQLLFGQIGLERRRQALSGVRLKFINVISNNDFSEYYGIGLNYYLSGKIGRGYFQVIADVLLKKYRADLSQYFLYYNPDPEQNIQNQLLVGWEWPFWKNLALTGRAAVMRNETHYSGIYYNKWFVSGGLIYRKD
ncbi:MAG TPA: hypothetical protein P5268_02830 [Candidatus Marinimicrobia bacterium]|nr:hypothetical protein [Candidatus Neomarinimicrobiota bacterium]HRS52265.1 hypothetical protein [Candidatus Neomarinimicrobiota bacterium]HRU91953.1 hypothetical protein [Candidatus Neomarinimicrobiota bacterium]